MNLIDNTKRKKGYKVKIEIIDAKTAARRETFNSILWIIIVSCLSIYLLFINYYLMSSLYILTLFVMIMLVLYKESKISNKLKMKNHLRNIANDISLARGIGYIDEYDNEIKLLEKQQKTNNIIGVFVIFLAILTFITPIYYYMNKDGGYDPNIDLINKILIVDKKISVKLLNVNLEYSQFKSISNKKEW